MDERGADADLLTALAERRKHLRVVVGKAPGAVGLREELDRVGADLDGAVERTFDAASAMPAYQHSAE